MRPGCRVRPSFRRSSMLRLLQGTKLPSASSRLGVVIDEVDVQGIVEDPYR